MLADEHDLDSDIRIRAAWLYFMEGMTQDAVAKALGITRARVLRMLQTAREDGTVQTRVTSQLRECIELERKLERVYGVERAIVIPKPQDDTRVGALVGAVTGAYLESELNDGMTVGLGWGRTLSSSLPHIAPRAFNRMTVVSLIGGLTRAAQLNPSEFAWQFSRLIGANCYLLAAPALVDSAKTRKALIERCGLNEVLGKSTKMDMALVSVGSMSAQATAFRIGFLSEAERRSLLAKGAVGDLLYNFFDADGRLLKHSINDRVMSMPIESLKSVQKRVLISGGQDKIEALWGGIKLLKANVLITNEKTAAGLLKRRAA